MKIGIPRSLLYYYYYPLWKNFFEELGVDVVASPPTTKKILDLGVRNTVSDICVPIKIFMGHFYYLMEKELDYIYVPRMVSIEKRKFFCPKFMGLPDLVRHTIENPKKVLRPSIVAKDDNIALLENFLPLAEPLGKTKGEIKKALKKAEKAWLHFRQLSKEGYFHQDAMNIALGKVQKENLPIYQGGEITIGLIGYVYNIYDDYISMNIMEKLQQLNIKVITFDMLPENEIERPIKQMDKALFWTFSNKLLGAGKHLFRKNQVDGIIHVTAFGCGPDSMIGKMFELESQDTQIPFMTLRIDEHTGENHLQTRVEAFTDMIKRKKV